MKFLKQTCPIIILGKVSFTICWLWQETLKNHLVQNNDEIQKHTRAIRYYKSAYFTYVIYHGMKKSLTELSLMHSGSWAQGTPRAKLMVQK